MGVWLQIFELVSTELSNRSCFGNNFANCRLTASEGQITECKQATTVNEFNRKAPLCREAALDVHDMPLLAGACQLPWGLGEQIMESLIVVEELLLHRPRQIGHP